MEVEIIEHDELEIDMGDGSFVLDNDYKNIKNKPQINGVELDGNKTLEELGIQGAEEGKGLSTNDFDDNYKKKLDELSNYDDTGIKKSISEANNKIEGLTTTVSNNTINIKVNEEAIKQANSNIETNTTNIANNSKAIETINKNIETINTKNTEQDTAINTNKTNIETLQNKVKTLDTDNTQNKQDITELQESVENNTEKITENTDALTKANNRIAELEQTVALQDEQIPRRRRRRREHYINR